MKSVRKNSWLKAGMLSGFLLLGGAVAQAQYLRTSYFMEGVSGRMKLNPALVPTRGYVDIPAIGSLNASVSSNSLGTNDIMDVFDNSDNFYSDPDFMGRLKGENRLNLSLNTDVISFGFHRGKGFWSFNAGIRADVNASIQKSMFEYLNAMDAVDDWTGLDYNIGRQELRINSYIELGVGYAREITDRLTVGGKVKFLLGAANLDLRINQIQLETNLPKDFSSTDVNDYPNWENYKALLNVDAQLESSMKGLELTESTNAQGEPYIDDLDFGNWGIAGYGAAVDFGVTYRLLDNLTVSASVLDLGFISWSEGSSEAAVAEGNIDMNAQDYATRPDGWDAFRQDAQGFIDRVNGGDVLDFDLMNLRKKDGKSRTTGLATTIALGAEYGFFHNTLSVGALFTDRFTPIKSMAELTLAGTYRPKSWMNVALSYSMIQSTGKSFGCALKLGPVFLGTDYMFLGNNSKVANAYVGVSIPLGRKQVACCDD